ncbi:hypothetical protein [Porphyrobacter sp. AAP82]|uniref:hypothetical protein n=1 Tax=Porphyrobacter sp. AAP82 TaxID=1248917 RepID=UPI0003056EEB|nr:hypothetical protein [Porphyrobacter sp. AAP82]
MIAELPGLPADAPASLNFLGAALVVLALQAVPWTGIFLMILAGPLWAGVLVTLAMTGILWEVATGQASPVWLALPGCYFGAYYLLAAWERIAASRIAAGIAAANAGQALACDPARQDVLLVNGKGSLQIDIGPLLAGYALARVFRGGQVHFLGTSEACLLARGEAARQSGVSCFGHSPGARAAVSGAMRACGIISAPGEPERPVLRVTSDRSAERRMLVPVQFEDFTLLDEASGATCRLRSGEARLLARFPFPIIGFALNSGAPKWQGFAGWMRQRAVPLADGGTRAGGAALVAGAMGLAPSDDVAARAVGAEAVAALIDASDTALADKELAILGTMLADPLTHVRDGWFRHLVIRPLVVVPYADRILAALHILQASDLRASENGRNLWRLLSALPDAVLEPHRARIVDWLDPAQARPWTLATDEIYTRLDAAVPQERAILLHRLESQHGDLKTRLLPGFARMGSAAPDDAKARLLALWQARAPDPATRGSKRDQGDAALYFTLARMGLKAAAGEVVQRYYGPTFAAIWREVEADSHAELCEASWNDLAQYFRGPR